MAADSLSAHENRRGVFLKISETLCNISTVVNYQVLIKMGCVCEREHWHRNNVF